MASVTVNPTPSSAEGGKDFSNINKRTQRTILNTSFERTTVVKPFNYTGEHINSVEDALSELGGDQKELIALLRSGLGQRQRVKDASDPNGWFILNEDGSGTPFSGEQLDLDKANALILGIAKTAFGTDYAKDPSAAKEMARNFVKSQPRLIEGIKVTPESVAAEAEAGVMEGASVSE